MIDNSFFVTDNEVIMKKVLLHYLRPYYGKMTLGFVIKFFGTIMDLFLPWILAYIIDSVIPTGNIRLIYLYGVLMVLCAIGAFVMNVVANRMASAVSRDTTRTIRHDLFARIMRLSIT